LDSEAKTVVRQNNRNRVDVVQPEALEQKGTSSDCQLPKRPPQDHTPVVTKYSHTIVRERARAQPDCVGCPEAVLVWGVRSLHGDDLTALRLSQNVRGPHRKFGEDGRVQLSDIRDQIRKFN
jgi:hypothetical protein